jgi:hypothetical protein
MSLIGNQSVILKSCAKFLGGQAAAGGGIAMVRSNFNDPSELRKRDFNWPATISYPAGYVPGYAFTIARTSGGLAAHTTITGEITTTSAMIATGINIDANLNASITETNALLVLIVALNSSMSASGTITDAQLAAIQFLEANISASGTITTADVSTVIWLLVSLNANGSLSNTITTLVNMSADIGGATPLSPEGLADAVWNSLKVKYTDPGSMGLLVQEISAEIDKRLKKTEFIALK